MPFITKDRREIMDLPEKDRPVDFIPQPGDLCYEYYKPMIEAWRAEPRWTTAHRIFRTMEDDLNDLHPINSNLMAAYQLAWQVFFIKYVWPYELQKIKDNGDI